LGTSRVLLAIFLLCPKSLPRVDGPYSSFFSAIRCSREVALTRVCERDLQSVGVAEAFAKRRDDSLFSSCSALCLGAIYSSSSPSPGLAYHNQRAEAANDQTPEDGGLVARSPVNILPGRGPEGDGRHCEICVWCEEVVGESRKRCGRDMGWWRCCRCTDAGLLMRLKPSTCSPPPRSNGSGLGRAGQEQADDVAPTYTYGIAARSPCCSSLPSSHHIHNTTTMRSFILGLLLGLLSFVSALSAAGSNLLVVVDDEADKGKYSTFWSDLTCKQ
jgi:hypothetical protein